MKQQIKTIQIIHLAFTVGAAFIYYYLANIDSLEDLMVLPSINTNSILYVLIPIIAYLFGNFMFKNILSKVDKKLNIEENLGAYQTASLVRWSVLEAAAFIIIINKPDFVLLGVILILYIAILRPSENNITRHLKDS